MDQQKPGDTAALKSTRITEPKLRRIPRWLQLVFPVVPASVFVSYRRADDESETVNLLATRLEQRLGTGSVYFDRNVNRGGDDWRKTVKRWATMSRRMVVVIGPNWAGEAHEPPRIQEKEDLVRKEVSIGIEKARVSKRYRICVAQLPNVEQDEVTRLIPRDLAALGIPQWTRIDPRNRALEDADRVLRDLHLKTARTRRIVWGLSLMALAALIAGTVLLTGWLLDRSAKSAASADTVSFEDGRYVLGGTGELIARQIPPFAIDTHEVSWAQYRECVERGPCDDIVQTGADDQPVTNLTAAQAQTFCEWLGRRLPEAFEWEVAVRGRSGRAWPWGNDEPTQASVNIDVGLEVGPETVALESVESRAIGATPSGIHHLVGNANEWTQTSALCIDFYACSFEWDYTDLNASLWVVGGGYKGIIDDRNDILAGTSTPGLLVDRQASSPGIDVGFRCATEL